jgi:hypothetical protein
MDSFSLDVEHPENHIAPDNSIQLYRAAVLFESEALWKEQNPVCRANIARQLTELAAKLTEMEEEARQFRERSSASDEAA